MHTTRSSAHVPPRLRPAMSHWAGLLAALLGAIVLPSCEEVIHIDLNSGDPALVAEGYIEKDSLCNLSLTYTTDFYQPGDPQGIADALVRLRDDAGHEEVLTSLGEGRYRGSTLRGEAGRTYTLEVELDGTLHSGESDLHEPPRILDIRSEDAPSSGPHGHGGAAAAHRLLHDRPGQPDDFLFQMVWNGTPIGDGYAIASDRYGSLGAVLEASFLDTRIVYGDTVGFRIYAIDAATADYYTQLNEALGEGMPMSATPYNPTSNLGEGVMGYFMARSHTDTTYIVVE
ncbi:MAG: DUF4249 family protein [Bacteroidales bacterium]